MATVRTNLLVNGLSGTLGTIVFKNYKGNTIVTNKPRPVTTQSTQQKANRSKFKAASAWAKEVLADAAMKEYYQRKAKKLKLPNAYTAAITDYMRSPKLRESYRDGDTIVYQVSKKNFELKKVEIVIHDAAGEVVQTKCIANVADSLCVFKLNKEERAQHIEVHVTDFADKCYKIRME